MPPIDPNHKHVDTPHPRTVVTKDWRYGCWNVKFEPEKDYECQDGWLRSWFRRIVKRRTKWKSDPAGKLCGHLTSKEDWACQGCYRRYK